MKVIIIEDEILMAKDLGQTLKNINPNIDIIAILSSVEEAMVFFKTNPKAELIFSDIELEDGLSFEIFKLIKIDIPVIFCTAYDEYALDAFDANGIEYILKPFNNASIKKSLDKFDSLRASISDGLFRQYKATAEALATYDKNKSTTLMIRFRDKLIPISFEQIALIYIETDVTYVYTKRKQSFVVNQTLDELEKKAGTNFFRVNRQFLVSRNVIEETAYAMHRKLNITFNISFQREVLVSKEKTSKFLLWLTE